MALGLVGLAAATKAQSGKKLACLERAVHAYLGR